MYARGAILRLELPSRIQNNFDINLSGQPFRFRVEWVFDHYPSRHKILTPDFFSSIQTWSVFYLGITFQLETVRWGHQNDNPLDATKGITKFRNTILSRVARVLGYQSDDEMLRALSPGELDSLLSPWFFEVVLFYFDPEVDRDMLENFETFCICEHFLKSTILGLTVEEWLSFRNIKKPWDVNRVLNSCQKQLPNGFVQNPLTKQRVDALIANTPSQAADLKLEKYLAYQRGEIPEALESPNQIDAIWRTTQWTPLSEDKEQLLHQYEECFIDITRYRDQDFPLQLPHILREATDFELKRRANGT